MCDHCGCRELTPVRRLMAEHERLLDLAGEVRAALRHGDEPSARRSFDELLALLWPHVRAEERGLFSVLRRAGEFVEYLDRLENDHRAFGAAAAAADGDWARRVPAILDELREHIEAEEYGLFPAALAALGGEQWDGMAAAWS